MRGQREGRSAVGVCRGVESPSEQQHGGERSSHPPAMHVSSLLGGPKGVRSRVEISKSDVPGAQHTSRSYRGATAPSTGHTFQPSQKVNAQIWLLHRTCM